MKKRVLCFLLSAIMLLGLVPVTALAEEGMTISDPAVEVLKNFEGFSPYAYYDYGQYSIGYGTSCGQYEYPNGITEEQGEILLRQRLAISEQCLNDFAAENGLTFNQGQFDALILFTYNVGEGWMRDTSARFRRSVIEGDTGNDFVYNMALWSTAGGAPHAGLLNRRLCEADMYLNGNYTNVARADYNYVILDAQGGTVEDRMQGYISSEEVMIRPVPTRTDYRFMGWYTQSAGGQWVTSLTANHDGLTLYAHWQKGEGDLDGKGDVMGTAVSYDCLAGNLASLNKYAQPSEVATVTGTLSADNIVSITADYVDDCGIKWGKLSSGGWVMLGSAVPSQPITSEPSFEVTVTNTYINVRQNPGASSALVGKVYQGDKLTIYRTRTVSGELWGKFSGGWVALKYTDYELIVENDSNAPIIATGVVVCNNYVNVRQNAGTAYAIVGKLLPGDLVEITEFKTVGLAQWARIRQGWACMDYVHLDENAEEPGDTTQPGDTTTQPETPSVPEAPEEDVLYTGTVINTDALRVRSAPGTRNPQVGFLTRGQKVEILEEREVDDAPWGRISTGWICLLYVQADPTDEELENAVTGVVTSNMNLNVRSAPGAHNALVTSLPTGTVVTIYQQTMLNGIAWGRIAQGWVCMTYIRISEDLEPELPSNPDTPVTPEKPENSPAIYNGSVINTNALRIRSGAGTHYAELGRLTMGTKVQIMEITLVNNVKWGRIDKGWICLDYVKLEPVPGVLAAPLSGTVVVGNTPLKIRTGAGVQNAIVGQLTNGVKITVYEITVVNNVAWGRIDNGWVCLDYVILEMPDPTVEPEQPTEPEETEPEETEPEETEPEETEPEETEPEETEPEETEPEETEPEETEPEETEPEETKPSEPAKDTVLYTGKVILTNSLRIRSAAGTTNPQVGTLTLGAKVELYEVAMVSGMKWGRIDKGWISLNYVQIDVTPENARYTLLGTVVVGNIQLKVRSAAGVQNAIVGQLSNGTKITVYEITRVNNVAWGRIDNGWVCLDYVTLEVPDPSQIPDNPGVEAPEDPTGPSEKPTEPDEEPEDPTEPEYTTVLYTGKIVLTNSLTVRTEPSTTAASAGTLTLGTKVNIYNVKTAGGVKWGRTEKGWISLYYVEPDLTEANVSNTLSGKVTAGNTTLKIRSGPSTQHQILGQLTNGTEVVIYDFTYTNNIPWGRIPQGWVCLDYVKLEIPDPSLISGLPGGEPVLPENPPAKDEQPTEPEQEPAAPDEELTDPETPKEDVEHLVILVTEDTIGSIVTDYPNLKSVNFKTSTCYDAIEAFAAANPDIAVTYQVCLGDTMAANTASSLYLVDGAYELDLLLQNLKYLPKVESIYLSKTTLTMDQIDSIRQADPEIDVTYSVEIGQNLVMSTAESATLVPGGVDFALLSQKLLSLPNLTAVHLRRTALTAGELEALSGAFPGVEVTYSVDMFGSELQWNAASISLAHLVSAQVEQAAARLELLPDLAEIKLINASGNSNLKVADVKKLMELAPDYEYQYKFNFYGKTVDIHDEQIVMENIYIGEKGVENLRDVLSIMRSCSYMNLGDPGISNESMAKLRDEFRGKTKVAWLVYYGAYKDGSPRSAMSDTEVLHHVYYLTDKNCDNLKYFEDVKYIDFGHNETLTRIDYIRYMPKLEMIILSGSAIRNLDAFANHQNIQFIEVAWCTNVSDISGVENCPNLKYLNISYTKPKDITVVHGLPLEMFMCIGAGVDASEKAAVQAAIPGCWITNSGNVGAEYSYGWRYNWDGTRTEPYDKLWDIFNYGAYWGTN